MIALLLFLGCAAVAGVLVAVLRQREGREQFKGRTFARRTAGTTLGVLGVALVVGVLFVAGAAVLILGNLRDSLSGCVNC